VVSRGGGGGLPPLSLELTRILGGLSALARCFAAHLRAGLGDQNKSKAFFKPAFGDLSGRRAWLGLMTG
jgi:hypothetical protein